MRRIFLLSGLMTILFACGAGAGGSKGQSGEDVSTDRRQVLISTTFGDIKIELFNETPRHRDNFIKLAEEGFYDQTLFHRVINGFMIQGGDPTSRNAPAGQQLGMGDPGYTLPAEFVSTLIHQKGALAAARQGDHVNPNKESSGSQFYIVQGRVFSHEELDMFEQRLGRTFTAEQRRVYTTYGGTPHLDGGYTVFGMVVEGLAIVDSIAAVAVDPASRPIEDIRIEMKVVR